MAIILETERLTLSEMCADDASFVLALLNDPGFLRHIGDRQVRTLDDARDYIANKVIGSYDTYGFGMYLMTSQRDGAQVGMCGLVKRDALDDVDVGYALLPAFRGSGYALEAAAAVLEYAGAELGIERIVAITSADNDASARLLRRLGFRFEKTLRLAADEDECRLYVRGDGH